jgi:hypothetical protein
MRKLLFVLATLAALGGCFRMDKTPPKDLPSYVRLYPGAQQMMNMSLGPTTADLMTTTDSPDQVVSFYRTQAASDGLTEMSAPAPAASAPGQVQAAFSDKATNRLLVVLARPQTEGQTTTTMVDLTYTTPKAAS